MPLLTDIPFDCINVIFEFFDDYRMLSRAACTCWWLWELAQEEDLWAMHCRRFLPKSKYERIAVHVHLGVPAAWFVSWQESLKQHFGEEMNKAIVGVVEACLQSFSAPNPSNFEMLRKTPVIDLSAHGVCVGTKAGVVLPELLRANRTLSTLSLSRQMMRDDGTLRVVGALSNIQILNLAGNKLSDKVFPALFESLQVLPHLQRLDLSSNNFTGESPIVAVALVKLVQLSSLTELMLNSMLIGDKCATRLLLDGVLQRGKAEQEALAVRGRHQRPVSRFSLLSLCDAGLTKKLKLDGFRSALKEAVKDVAAVARRERSLCLDFRSLIPKSDVSADRKYMNFLKLPSVATTDAGGTGSGDNSVLSIHLPGLTTMLFTHGTEAKDDSCLCS